MPKIHSRACLVVSLILLASTLTSCAYSKYDDPVRPSAESLAAAEQVIEEMLQEDLGYHSPIRVESARENTCRDPVLDDDWNRVTEVRTYAGGRYPDAASSKQAMITIESYVKSKGWTPIAEDSSADSQFFVYEQGDLRFSAHYEYAEPSAASPYHEVFLDVRTGCVKQEKDHELVRSKYDPGYGLTSEFYDFQAERENPADFTQRRLSTPQGEQMRLPVHPD